MSISSTSWSNGTSGIGAALANGYRLTTTRSTGVMPWAAEGREIVGPVPPGQDAGVDGRVQRLDPAVHHLGKAGDVGDVDDRQAFGRQRLRGAARWTPARHRAPRGRAAERREAGLIRNTQNCTHIWLPFVDNCAASALPFPRRWAGQRRKPRPRHSRSFFVSAVFHKPGAGRLGHAALRAATLQGRTVRCVSQARSSGSTTPRVTDSSSATAAAMYSFTSRRSRATASGLSRRARRSSSKSSTVRRARQAGNVTKVS